MIYLLFFLFSFLFSQTSGIVDGVLVVVGDDIILRSDIEEQVFMIAKQKNISPQKQPLAFDRLFKRVVEEQIDRLVVLNFAKQDTFISVTNEEVLKTLNQRIDAFVDVFGSIEALEDTMKMSVNTIKSEYYKVVEEELFVEKFRYQNFNSTSISRQDVVVFFENNPDSFPSQNPKISFSLIQQPVELSSETKDSIFLLANTIQDSLSTGLLSFDIAAKRYSQDPGSANSGGGLGYTKRGSLLSSYEKVAFSLNPGEISKPIESEYGYHIILLEDRLGEKIKTKHILFSLKPGPVDLKKIKNNIQKQKDLLFYDPSAFDSLAIKKYEEYKNLSGYYVDFNFSTLPLFLQKKINTTADFSFSDIFDEGGFVFLLYKYKKELPTEISLQKDWVLIESTALLNKNYDLFKEWITNKKKDIYIKRFYN